jgi:DNA-directed RNA polymerase specialized sigma24 family protein
VKAIPTLLRAYQRVLEAHGIERYTAKRISLALLLDIGTMPSPTPSELRQFQEDERACSLMNQGVPAEVIALRAGCSRSTVYKRVNRALDLKRTA